MIELLDLHTDMLTEEFESFDSMDQEKKIECLKEIYDKAVDKENAEKAVYMEKLKKEMHGKVMNEYKSYDLMDNEKYQRIEYLLQVMQENFGYDLNAAGIGFDPADNEAGAASNAPREVNLQDSPDYDDNYEFNKGISCCFFCSVPKAAYWLCCWSGVMVVFTILQLFAWFILFGKFEKWIWWYSRVMYLNAYLPTIYSMYVFYNAIVAMLMMMFLPGEQEEPDLTMNGLIWLFILYSVFELCVRIFVCVSLNPLGCGKKRNMKARQEAMRVPLILIGLFVFTFALELIVYYARFKELSDGLETIGALLGEEL